MLKKKGTRQLYSILIFSGVFIIVLFLAMTKTIKDTSKKKR